MCGTRVMWNMCVYYMTDRVYARRMRVSVCVSVRACVRACVCVCRVGHSKRLVSTQMSGAC